MFFFLWITGIIINLIKGENIEVVCKYKDKLKDYFFPEILIFILFSDNNQHQLLISSGYAGCALLPTYLKKQFLVSNRIFLKQHLGNLFAYVNFCIIVVIYEVLLSKKTFTCFSSVLVRQPFRETKPNNLNSFGMHMVQVAKASIVQATCVIISFLSLMLQVTSTQGVSFGYWWFY